MSRSGMEKVYVLGDRGVGKTSLIFRFYRDEFLKVRHDKVYCPSTNSSLPVPVSLPKPFFPGFHEPPVKEVVTAGKQFTLSVWDTTAQDESERLRPLFYPGMNVFLLCFSIEIPGSLESIQEKWHPEMLHHRTSPKIPFILVGCKSDLRTTTSSTDASPKFVARWRGEEVARLIGAVAYIECSAMTGDGVIAVFETAAEAAFRPRTTKQRKGCIPF
ncbi:GTP-binding protein Rho1 [Serendipita sp. 397]|nr:GTP-binding protein Rho1 [Serendipita sp. 397]